MIEKELEPLLLNSKQVRQLTGLTTKTLVGLDGFPKPVRLVWGNCSAIQRNLWKRSSIEKWIKKLDES